MKNIPPFCLIFVVSFCYLVSCSAIKHPVFNGIDNVQVGSLNKKGVELSMYLHFNNSSNSKLKLKKAEGDAWMGENLLGHFIMDTLIVIPPLADFIIPVKLITDKKNLLSNSLMLLMKQEVLIKIDGKAKVGKSGIYISYPIKYEGKQDLSNLVK